MNLDESVMRAIARILETDSRLAGTAQPRKSPRIRPVFRMAVVFLCILLCALSRNMFFVLCLLASSLVRLALRPAETVLRVLRSVMFPVLLSFVLLLPAALMGHPASAATIALKLLCTLLLLALLGEDLSFGDITGALGQLFVPSVFIFTLDMAVRFLILLGRYSHAMLEAIRLRSTGRRSWKESGAGGVLGSTFLHAGALAAGTAEAMECRGFDGSYKARRRRGLLSEKQGRHTVLRPGAAELCYLLLIPLLIAAYAKTRI